MSKCNLFKPLDSKTGTFYMFSQYTNDLTLEYTNKDTYRVVPSKYIALNLDINKIPTIPTSEDYNYILGEIFQNYFENACAFLRNKQIDNKSIWNPNLSYDLLFQTLQKYDLLSIETDKKDENVHFFKEIQYIGDINIYSQNTVDGIGYNEIYCMIPNEANKRNYFAEKNSKEKLFYAYGQTGICGYDDEDKTLPQGLSFTALTDYDDLITTNGYYLYNNHRLSNNFEFIDAKKENINTDEQVEVDDKTNNLDSFKFNTIIVLYDIQNKNGEIKEDIYKNIPMGIYFTGKDESISVYDDATQKYKITHQLSNGVTKYVNNDDIFGQGTSYGLRICSRYLCFPNITIMTDSATETLDMDYELYSKVMSKMNESQDKMDDVIQNTLNINTTLNEHLANFKNNKVNIPYTRIVEGKEYWFVNGKNTGALANKDTSSLDLSAYQKKEDNSILGDYPSVVGSINNLTTDLNQVKSTIDEKANKEETYKKIDEKISNYHPHKDPAPEGYTNLNTSAETIIGAINEVNDKVVNIEPIIFPPFSDDFIKGEIETYEINKDEKYSFKDSLIQLRLNINKEWIDTNKDDIEVCLFRRRRNKWTLCQDNAQYKGKYPIKPINLSDPTRLLLNNEKDRNSRYHFNLINVSYIMKRYIKDINFIDIINGDGDYKWDNCFSIKTLNAITRKFYYTFQIKLRRQLPDGQYCYSNPVYIEVAINKPEPFTYDVDFSSYSK